MVGHGSSMVRESVDKYRHDVRHVGKQHGNR